MGVVRGIGRLPPSLAGIRDLKEGMATVRNNQMKDIANKTMGRKALNVKDSVLPELSGYPSPLEGKCAQTSPRSKMAVFWSTWFF